MCKFNNRLFVFHIYCLLGLELVQVFAKPLDHRAKNGVEDFNALGELFALFSPQDVHYDQRQKGDENYRIKLDGFFIGLPQEDSTALLLLTDDIFESLGELQTYDEYLAAFGKNKPTSGPAEASPTSTILSTTTSASFDSNDNLTSSTENSSNNSQARLVEIPAPKRFMENRESLDSGSIKPRNYISHFLKLLKRNRKY